ncbi:MAG: RimK family alpha-L-glutamate ligase [Motiliproteus sp.]
MKIGILTTNQVQDDNRLVEAATEKGHSASLLDLRDVSIDLSLDFTTIYYRNEEITREFDAIVPRLNVSFTDYGINILQQFMCTHTYVSESPDALRLGRDKLKCLQFLLNKRLPFPGTGIAYSCDNFTSIISRLKFPLVIKLIESTEGIGVFLAQNQMEAENIIKTFSLLRAPFLVQEFIDEAEGQDIRAFVVGDRVAAAMKRTSLVGDFRANVSLGAHSVAEKLTDDEEQIVLQATKSIGVNVAGVDFVRSHRGPLLLEINVSPDFTGEQGIEKITNIDIAAAIIDYTVGQAHEFNYN